MSSNKAFNGDLEENPFNFEHFNVSEVALLINGTSHPGPRYKPDFGSGQYQRDYSDLMETFNYYNSDDTNGLTQEDFTGGYTIYAFDLTPDNDISGDYRHPNLGEDIRLDLTFKTTLSETINVLIYAVFDSQVQITKLRDVIADYHN